MNYTKIKTFKGLDYRRSESTTNLMDKYKKFFLEEPGVSVPTSNLTQDLESTSGFSRVPLSGVNRISDRPTSFNKSTVLFVGLTGLILFYLVIK